MSDYLHIPDEQLTSGVHISPWIDSVAPLHYNTLDHDLQTQVVIVGGGIAGVSIAYNLSRNGIHVVLVEDGYIGSGETGRTTAHIVNCIDDRYYELQKTYKHKGAALIAQSHTAAIDFIEHTVQAENINCDFERLPGYLFLHNSDKSESLDKELKAAAESGVSVEAVDPVPGLKKKMKGIRFTDQAQFHPLKYIQALCKCITDRGGKIFTSTQVTKIDETGITTGAGYTVKAAHIVVATNSPINDKYRMHLKQFAYRSYVLGATIKKNSLPKALWWDTGDFDTNKNIPPYHYMRLAPFSDREDLLICGGEDHPTGIMEDKTDTEARHYEKLEAWMREMADFDTIKYRWSGQVMEPADGIAYIGKNPGDENIYIVTGDSGNGMTHGTIAGILIPDLIRKKENPWKEIYDPARFKLLSSASTWFSELIGGFVKYIKQNPKHTNSVELDSISAGEGKIIEIEGHKMGAYRDTDGTLHFVSAKCTHLGCIVKWNHDEKSWDCPCHGSRFTIDGKILNGPALINLEYHTEHIQD